MIDGQGGRATPDATNRWGRRAGRILVAGLTGLLAVAVVASGAPAGASPATVRVGRPPRIPAGAAAVSSLPGATALRVDVVLQPRDPAGLAAYANAVSTPGSEQFRHFLGGPQFVSRFGPTAATIASVDAALTAGGLHPGAVSANHLSIPVRATAGQLSAAFATGFSQYRVAGGRLAFANRAAPQIASSVASAVQGVVGLDDLTLPAPALGHAPTGAAHPRSLSDGGSAGPRACATAATDAVDDGSYTADEVGTAYGFPALYDQGDLGSGQTVALYELQGFGQKDIDTYQSCFDTSTSISTVDVDGGPQAHSGVGEADVDIEQVVALAPSTHILVYQGPNTNAGGYDTYDAIVSQDEASVVSTSWGLCESEMGSAAAQAENTLFEEAATQGQTIVAASGDEGSEDCVTTGDRDDGLAVDDPSSQPFVTGAGGTEWTASGTPPTETAWNDGPTCCWGAGGGGISTLWTMPTYQADSAGTGVINAGSSGTPCGAPSGSYCRESPDVSALAGPYPYLEYVSGGWGSWGGTSLAAPLWASLIDLSDASAACDGKDIGFANPLLYQVAADDPAAFYDVTVGNNDLTGTNDGAFPALTGYDMATGLGTPSAGLLPGLLCTDAVADPITITQPGSQTSLLDSAVSLAIHATDATSGQSLTFSVTGLPTGLSIERGNGLISGTVDAIGTFEVVVKAQDGDGAVAAVNFTWTVGVAITSPDSAAATVVQPFSFTVVTTGAPTSLTMKGKRPSGLSFAAKQGVLSGTPKARDTPGEYPLVIRAVYGKGKKATAVSQDFTLTLTG
jgi:subtilase family serine protease